MYVNNIDLRAIIVIRTEQLIAIAMSCIILDWPFNFKIMSVLFDSKLLKSNSSTFPKLSAGSRMAFHFHYQAKYLPQRKSC